MTPLVKDPVCGMMVHPREDLAVEDRGQRVDFCSELCRRTFLAEPAKFVRAAATSEPSPAGARRIAYFSMEAGVDSTMPTYSGGLGVLAGDTLKSCADLKVPVVAVTLLYRKGYFDQVLDDWGNQREQAVLWDPSAYARRLPPTVKVSIERRVVSVRAWQYDIVGSTGYVVPLVLLDTNVDGNAPGDRELTSYLYGGDDRYRMAQEIILGIGGVRMLRALGYTELERFHMNEGHSACLAVELLRERKQEAAGEWPFNAVRGQCIFTTHTPVPAGHDQFSYELVQAVWDEAVSLEVLRMLGGTERLNMTRLALNMSHFVNGVAKKHGAVSQEMFPGYPIDSITNGVHSATWTAPSFQKLYDRHMPGWRTDPFSLRYAVSIRNQEVWDAHEEAKARLLDEVNRRTAVTLKREALTIGFARRATLYKRADLVFSDQGRLLDIARQIGPLQFIFAGKAHPKDEPGQEMIRRVVGVAKQLPQQVRIVYLENYDVAVAQLLTAGVDLWLNTPLRPLEASGTSGMKAAHNAVPSLSVLDGWWIEGYIEGVTGWSIGPRPGEATADAAQEARELYEKLHWTIAPMYYKYRDRWIDVMRHTVAFNASFFNTHRMVQQYAASADV